MLINHTDGSVGAGGLQAHSVKSPGCGAASYITTNIRANAHYPQNKVLWQEITVFFISSCEREEEGDEKDLQIPSPLGGPQRLHSGVSALLSKCAHVHWAEILSD